MHIVLIIAIVILLSWMFVLARDSTRLPPDDQKRKKRAWWFFSRISKRIFAGVWTILNVTTALLILFLAEDYELFRGGQKHIRGVVAFGVFILLAIGIMTISRPDFIWWKYSWLVMLGIIFWFVLLLTSSAIIPNGTAMGGGLHAILERPGTLFVAILGLITIIGFIFTFTQLRETNARITDYSTLLRRLDVLLKEAIFPKPGWGARWFRLTRSIRNLFDKMELGIEIDDRVRIYVRTLALGSMSTRKEIFQRYLKKLNDLFERGKSIVVQLDHSKMDDISATATDAEIESILRLTPVGELYLQFHKNRGFNLRAVAAGYKDAKEACTELYRRGVLFNKIADPDDLTTYKHIYYVRPTSKDFPSYHLFVSSQRAIVITALDLPIGSGGRIEGWNKGAVHVVALETTNLHVVERLIITFDAICSECCDKDRGGGEIH